VEEMIAPTENCPWRKKILCGEVHDDNAYAMGGVAGHAGLFSSARDIHTFLLRIDRCLRGEDHYLPQALVQEFLTKDESVSGSTFALADTPPAGSSSGSLFSDLSAIWVLPPSICDLKKLPRDLVDQSTTRRARMKRLRFRPQIHDLIMKALAS
jgi:hypothetical protein